MRKLKTFVRGRLLRLIGGFNRQTVSHEYLKGSGLEIGALHRPLELPSCARAKYVDRMRVPELRKHYPELAGKTFVPVDILDDGETLGAVPDSSQDFVIANHFLEHCENPVLAVRNLFRVLKVNGVAYFTLPDKRFTFDADRPVTAMEHIWKDYTDGPEGSRRGHYEEWVRKVEKRNGEEEIAARTGKLMSDKYSIHFHVFTQDDMFRFISLIKERAAAEFEVKLCLNIGVETIFILKKGGA